MKWNSTPVIALVAALIFAGAAALLFMAGGDGDSPADGSVATATASPVSNTPVSEKFGDPPRLGDNVEEVLPAWGQSVTQAQTVPVPDLSQPAGACAVINFQDAPDQLRWFHMAYDGELVTHLTTAFLRSSASDPDNPDGAILCYMPDEGLSVGVHTAAVSVTNPNDPNATPRQVVAWAFEVTP